MQSECSKSDLLFPIRQSDGPCPQIFASKSIRLSNRKMAFSLRAHLDGERYLGVTFEVDFGKNVFCPIREQRTNS